MFNYQYMYSLIDIFKKSVILRNNHILGRVHIRPRKIGISRRKEKMRRNLTGKTALLVLLCMAVMLLAGCGAAAEAPQPTPTATLEPTLTPEAKTTLQSTQDPVIGEWESAVFYDESGNPTVDTSGLIQLTVYEDGSTIQEYDGGELNGEFIYIASDDVYDMYIAGQPATIAKYNRDLEIITIDTGSSAAQFRRK